MIFLKNEEKYFYISLFLRTTHTYTCVPTLPPKHTTHGYSLLAQQTFFFHTHTQHMHMNFS